MSTSDPNRNSGFPRKYIYVMVGIVAVISIAVLAGGATTPDFDAMIESKDCNAINALTESDLEKANVKQQTSLALLIVGCAFGG